MLNSPCALQDEEVLEELPEEAEEDASTATTSTTKEEVGAQSSAVQVGQEQIPAANQNTAGLQPVRCP